LFGKIRTKTDGDWENKTAGQNRTGGTTEGTKPTGKLGPERPKGGSFKGPEETRQWDLFKKGGGGGS